MSRKFAYKPRRNIRNIVRNRNYIGKVGGKRYKDIVRATSSSVKWLHHYRRQLRVININCFTNIELTNKDFVYGLVNENGRAAVRL